jgi:hypothetical protein
MGFNQTLRRFDPAHGWTVPATRLWRLGKQPARAGPLVASASLPVRAHVSFVPLRPPRLIFVGVTDRLLEGTRSAKAIGRGCGWRRLLGFALPSAVRRSGTRSSRATILPWALPLAGLSDTLPCIAPGPTPRAITSPRNRHTAICRAPSLSARGLSRRSFRSRTKFRRSCPPCRWFVRAKAF